MHNLGLTRREILGGGLAIVASGLIPTKESHASHVKHRRPMLQPEQVASLGNTPIEQLRRYILYKYLREKQMVDYCVADESHTQRSKSSIDAECSDAWTSGMLFNTYKDGDFKGGNLFVKAEPVGEIKTLDGKLKAAPSEPFPFAVEISYLASGGSQVWSIQDFGVKGDLLFHGNDPKVKDRFTAALPTGRGLEYFLSLRNGYRLGQLEFKDKVVQENGGSKDATVKIVSFDENSMRLTFSSPRQGGTIREFQFPPGIPESYLKSHSGVTVIRERVSPEWREKHGDVYYRMGDGGGFYRKMNLGIAEGIDKRAMEVYGRARMVTKAVYHHLIQHLTERGIIKL